MERLAAAARAGVPPLLAGLWIANQCDALGCDVLYFEGAVTERLQRTQVAAREFEADGVLHDGMEGRTEVVVTQFGENVFRLLRIEPKPDRRSMLQPFQQLFDRAQRIDSRIAPFRQQVHLAERLAAVVQERFQEPVSLETPIGEEEDSHLGDFIPDEYASEPAEAASFTFLREQLMSVLDTLTEREKRVLMLRFGIADGRTRTLEEVGKEFNVTRERIRQIEAKALRKLRHPSRSKKLKDFLN